MRKVFITRKINEDVNITDPTLAQQFLAVKKQIADKRTKLDQQTKTINQINNEINILEKNLIAIETKAATQQNKPVTTQKPAAENVQKAAANNANTTTPNSTNTGGQALESMSILRPKGKFEIPSLDDYREMVIGEIDNIYNDGETLAYMHDEDVQESYELRQSPEEAAKRIVDEERNSRDNADETTEIPFFAPEVPFVAESIGDYKEGMELLVNGKKKVVRNVEKDHRPKFDIVHLSNDGFNSEPISSKWLDQQNIEILSTSLPKKRKLSSKQREDKEEQLYYLQQELRDLKQDLRNLNVDMEEDLAGYEEADQPGHKILAPKPKHDVYGEMLNSKEEEIEQKEKEIEAIKQSLNESVTDEIVSTIDNELVGLEKELSKLQDIKNFITNYDEENHDEDEMVIQPIEVEDDDEENGIALVPHQIPEYPELTKDFSDTEEDEIDFMDDRMDYDNSAEDIVDKDFPFDKSDDDRLVDETLKAEDKPSFKMPSLREQEDIETELELMNYEDEDEPRDEYCFHIRINPGEEDEIIAKIYKDTDDENWVVRVVKGDEQPLENMELDHRLDKIEIIGELASIPGFKEIEIIDPKEYEYLLDDKDKIDDDYYESEND